LLARRSEVEQARWQLRLGRRFFEFPELGFGWQEIRERSATIEGPIVSLSWPLPVFERQQPERIEAAARLVAAEARMELASVRARAELSVARAAYLRLREAALRALETVGESDRVVESATATFRVGESRLTDLLETLRSVLSARMAALDLYTAALEAHRTLELSAGRPLTDGGSK
jgi:cobalt-zinc-cadmium efflux system outer membrane protein